ncbi:MAG: 16S rRNA (guanine(527)-N(7))-methyltransferase RsmG, partial [Mesorhizobium sp.]
LDLSAPWLTSGARGLFHKGRDYRAEVQESVNRWTFDLVEHPSVTDASGVILELSNVRPV